jgi:MFS family permease
MRSSENSGGPAVSLRMRRSRSALGRDGSSNWLICGSLATILSVKFFEKSHPVAALLSTIALLIAGFLVRPLGAFVFGWLGDVVGRKYTFIMTLVGMALGAGAIGLIPTFDRSASMPMLAA